jgi:hypothetical protein
MHGVHGVAGQVKKVKDVRDIQRVKTGESRWPAILALIALGGLYAGMPSSLLVGGPPWLLLVVVSVLIVPTHITHRRGIHALSQLLGYILNGVVTATTICSLALLLMTLPAHTLTPIELLRAATGLWAANFLVFASWYWRLDAGGPHQRDQRTGHASGAFLFPQMMMTPEAKIAAGERDWSPNFIDYLFLAFNTSTAFSPTDVLVLSRWAKLLMMTQSMISLLVIALLAARAVNIL